MIPPAHPAERARLAALALLEILDTPAEERFDRVTRLATTTLGMPIAMISLIDAEREWFKSTVGSDLTATSRDVSFGAHAIADDGTNRLVVRDATLDDRFRDNPLVAADPHVRFYAGQVVRSSDGHPVGTLCVIDTRARELDADQLRALEDLAAVVEDELARTTQLELTTRLDESERMKGLVLDSLDEGLVLQDASGRIVEWNRRAEEVLGLSADELAADVPLGELLAAVHVDDSPWDESECPALVTLRTGEAITDQTMGIDRRDGQRVWLRVRTRPILDHHGRLRGVLSVFDDVTAVLEQRSTEAALTERLRAAIDDSPLGTGLADRLGRLTYVNDSYAHLLGIDPVTAIGHSAFEFVHPDDQTAGSEQLVELRDGIRHEVTVELRVFDAQGAVKRARVHVARLEPATTAAAYLLQVEDISVRHELEAALHRSEEVARVSLDSLEQGVLLIGAGGVIHRMNPAAERMLGYPPEQLTELWHSGQWISYDEHGVPMSPERRPIATALATGEPVRGALIRWERPDGTHAVLRVSCLPTDIGQDGPGLVVALTDVSERRQLERQLERYGVLFHHANDIIAVAAADGRLKFASPSHQRILGYPDDWAFPGGILGLVHPDDHDAAAERFGELVDGTSGDAPFTVRVRPAVGEWRYFECVGVNLLDDPAVRGILLTFRDVTERQQLLHELEHRAAHDLLTELPNRALLADRLSGALARARRGDNRIALCYLDLDGFKAVNDTHGHAVGDRVLVAVADRLRAGIRAGDMPARIGGDEFVVILDPVGGTDDALMIANRLRDAVLGDDDMIIDGIRCGVSIGVAINRADDDPDSLSARADTALYEAKARGDRSIVIAPVVGQLT